VVGIDGTSLGGVAYPPLTSIDVNIAAFATSAVNMLLDYVNDKKLPPRMITHPTSLLLRESA